MATTVSRGGCVMKDIPAYIKVIMWLFSLSVALKIGIILGLLFYV